MLFIGVLDVSSNSICAISGASKRAHSVPTPKTIGTLTKLVARVTHTTGNEHAHAERKFGRKLHLSEVVRRHTAEIIAELLNESWQCTNSADPFLVAVAREQQAAGKKVCICSNDADLRLLALAHCVAFIVPSAHTMRMFSQKALINHYRAIFSVTAEIDDARLMDALTHIRRVTGGDENPLAPISVARAVAALLQGVQPRDLLVQATVHCTEEEKVRCW
jgi:hypothetical protein